MQNNTSAKTAREAPLTYEEALEICTKKCGCCTIRPDGKINCLNPYRTRRNTPAFRHGMALGHQI